MVGAREGRSRHIRRDVVVLTGVIVLGVTSLNELPLLLGAALENVFFWTNNKLGELLHREES